MQKNFEFIIIGKDKKQLELVKYLNNSGYKAKIYNDDILTNKICILPVPMCRDGVNITNTEIPFDRILEYKPLMILAGIVPNICYHKAEIKNIKIIDYYKDESLITKNAELTAEAALAIAIINNPIGLINSKSLIIGFGRIGSTLAKYLKSLGSNVTATSRNPEKCKIIIKQGFNAINTNLLKNEILDFNYIFNTVPYPILNNDFFDKCQKSVFIEDLATNSGCSIEYAKQIGLNADTYKGLPGIYKYKTAANYIGETILNLIKQKR